MKAYVIKNKDGKMLCWHHIAGYYFDHFNIRSLLYMEIGTEREIKTVFNNKEFDNTDCSIVPITITEGDLEEENKQLKQRQNDFCDIVVSNIEIWLQQEGFYAEEFEDLFDLIKELKWNEN